jgi:hypothetical protein
LPDNFIVAFAAFGVIGVGASELIFYPYWCLEKGYAKHIGPRDGSAEWTARAQGLSVDNSDLIPTLSAMYSESFGAIGLWIFLIGACIVLYSTVFIHTAGSTRLTVDALRLFGLIYVDDVVRRRYWIKVASVAIPAIYFLFFAAIGSPVSLVLVGAIAQAVMLPLLCFGALYHFYRDSDSDLHPSAPWILFRWISAALMTATGVYQFLSVIGVLAS